MIPFYELSLEARLALTEAAMAEKRTLTERWLALATEEASHWDARAAMAAALLADAPSVADFGCGTMGLARHLRPDQRYIPLDVTARDHRTLVCDLNAAPPPETGAVAAACLGLLEYIHDPLALLRALHGQYPVLVVSYCVTDAPGALADRRAHAWVNDFSEAEMTAVFRASGWKPDAGRMVGDLQNLWRLTKNPF
ncbi:RRP8 family class I SAM-dependent methyltransferase [Acidisoma silvae]|uniref:Uncharacterized protein n=1 Tax=Acidisoma silvae TaxID=2802396 RepID=A0A963YVG7_9PROT|nr:RRP8 family class I SAM-dependent methyltransferase [Acidisoma silvae]MCB8877569.1 hypothetical protein [Acidisoma silvae]